MSTDTTRIRIAGNGSIRVAAVGTTAPTDDTSAYGAGWVDLGLCDDSGVKWTDDKSINDTKSWQSFYPTRKNVVTRSGMVSFNLQEWSKANVILAFGGGTVTTVSAGHYKFTPPDPALVDLRAVAVDWADGSLQYRLIFPQMLVTQKVETTLARTAAGILPITFEIVGKSGQDPYDLYTNDPAFA